MTKEKKSAELSEKEMSMLASIADPFYISALDTRFPLTTERKCEKIMDRLNLRRIDSSELDSMLEKTKGDKGARYALFKDPKELRKLGYVGIASEIEKLILYSAIHLESAERSIISSLSDRPLVCFCQETGSFAVQRAHANLVETPLGKLYSKIHSLPRKVPECKGRQESINPIGFGGQNPNFL